MRCGWGAERPAGSCFWFTHTHTTHTRRYLVFGPDREELVSQIKVRAGHECCGQRPTLSACACPSEHSGCKCAEVLHPRLAPVARKSNAIC